MSATGGPSAYTEGGMKKGVINEGISRGRASSSEKSFVHLTF